MKIEEYFKKYHPHKDREDFTLPIRNMMDNKVIAYLYIEVGDEMIVAEGYKGVFHNGHSEESVAERLRILMTNKHTVVLDKEALEALYKQVVEDEL